MKIIMALFLVLFCFVTISVAGELQEQPGCNLPVFLKESQVIKPTAYLAGEKNIPVGQTVGIGDVLFYATFKDAKKFYKANEDVLLNDKSPLNPNSKIQNGQLVPVAATINIDAETTLDVIVAPGGILSKKYFPVKPDGFICSTGIDYRPKIGWTTVVGMPVVMQGSPLTQKTEEFNGAKTRSVAIVLQKVDGAIASVQVSLIVDGQQQKTVTRGYDLFAGAINLSGLSMQIKKDGPGVKIVSVSEPKNYYLWMSDFFGINLVGLGI